MFCVQADETKAANHIDFTSVPYEGPALKKGQELLVEAREKAKEEATSLQRGWYYSGQLDHMVVWEKGACCSAANAPCGCRVPVLTRGTFCLPRCLRRKNIG